MRFCKKPFEHFEIDRDNNVYICCPWYINLYKIGNIFEDSIEEIWNSEKIQIFREKILNGDYSMCNLEKCCEYQYLPDIPEKQIKEKYSTIIKEYPKHISLDYDKICNAKCIICRDELLDNNNKDLLNKYNKIEEKIIPLFKEAETVYISGSGEIFYSNHSKQLVKKLAKLYPNLKFKLISNGLLCNRENIKELGLIGKIKHLTVSIHAATEETHKKIVRSGNFNTILKNLESLQEMKEKEEIENILLVYIVNSLNYKEIPAFVELTKKFNMHVIFCEYVAVPGTEMGENAKNYSIHLPSHPQHIDFLKILQDENLKDKKYCSFNPILEDLRIKAQNLKI